jgi:N-acetylmuramoyl-L-alanine amidase
MNLVYLVASDTSSVIRHERAATIATIYPMYVNAESACVNRYASNFQRVGPLEAIMIRQSMTMVTVVLLIALVACNAEARRTGPKRTQAINMIVIHSTGGPTCDAKTNQMIWVNAGTLDENMRSIEAHPKLGIHYMIDRDGALRTSVPEDQVAHHVLTFSTRSIAIELINDGDGRDAFADAQLDTLVKLLRDIVQRRGVMREGIKRHSDLDRAKLPCDKTQRRKVDPGVAFPYEAMLDRVFSR